MSYRMARIRKQLEELAIEHDDNRLLAIADELHNRKPVRQAPPQRETLRSVNPAEVRRYAETHPDLDYVGIGAHFNLNAGRVSEAVAGKRT